MYLEILYFIISFVSCAASDLIITEECNITTGRNHKYIALHSNVHNISFEVSNDHNDYELTITSNNLEVLETDIDVVIKHQKVFMFYRNNQEESSYATGNLCSNTYCFIQFKIKNNTIHIGLDGNYSFYTFNLQQHFAFKYIRMSTQYKIHNCYIGYRFLAFHPSGGSSEEDMHSNFRYTEKPYRGNYSTDESHHNETMLYNISYPSNGYGSNENEKPVTDTHGMSYTAHPSVGSHTDRQLTTNRHQSNDPMNAESLSGENFNSGGEHQNGVTGNSGGEHQNGVTGNNGSSASQHSGMGSGETFNGTNGGNGILNGEMGTEGNSNNGTADDVYMNNGTNGYHTWYHGMENGATESSGSNSNGYHGSGNSATVNGVENVRTDNTVEENIATESDDINSHINYTSENGVINIRTDYGVGGNRTTTSGRMVTNYDTVDSELNISPTLMILIVLTNLAVLILLIGCCCVVAGFFKPTNQIIPTKSTTKQRAILL